MEQTLFALSLGLGAAILAAGTADAQARNCAAHAVVVEQLAARYGESRQSIGLGANNTVVEVFASATGSWTITATSAAGMTCLVASGQAFELVTEALPNTDSGA